jgi:hypothetical protein
MSKTNDYAGKSRRCYRRNITINLLQFLQGVVPQEAEDIEVEEGGTAAQQQVGGGADLVASAIKNHKKSTSTKCNAKLQVYFFPETVNTLSKILKFMTPLNFDADEKD